MSVENVLNYALDCGVDLFLQDGALRYRTRKGSMPEDLRSKLQQYKTEIIEILRDIERAADAKRVSSTKIVKCGRDQPLLTSFAQQRLWLLDQIDGDSAHYNMPNALRLNGALSVSALNRAFESILERHESLRTSFIVGEDGQPFQLIHEAVSFSVPIMDLSALEDAERQNQLSLLASEEARRVFDLSNDLMLRASLLKIAEEEHILLVTMHHIASDGWSMSILINEFSALYSAYSQHQENPLAPLLIQYADYAHWQRNWLQGDALDQQLSYWKMQLASLPVVHSLPLDYARPQIQSFNGQNHVSLIDAVTSKTLSSLCQSQGATLFMGLHAAFAVLLSRYSNETDIVIGSPIANREQAEVAGLIGFFVNTLVLRSDLSSNPSFSNLLAQSKAMLLDAYAYQQVPFEKIVEALKPERSLSHSALFQVMLILQNMAGGSLELPGLTLSPVAQKNVVAKYDLTLTVSESEKGLALVWEYNSDLFEATSIARMAGHFEVLLKALVSAPEESVFKVDMLNLSERHQLLGKWNDSAINYPKDKCIHELFEIQVELNPNAVAVVFEGQQLTYSELNAKANQIAHYLINEKQVKPDTLVGICVERSLEMLTGILGILKAGGAYVPLDPDYPEARLAYMLGDAGLATILTQSHLQGRTPITQKQAFCLDAEDVQILLGKQSSTNPHSSSLELTSRHLAYVIYTSGSTGNPKGVMVEHTNLVNFIIGMMDKPGIRQDDCLLALTSTSFDIHGLELFLPLTSGARVVVASKAESINPELLIQRINSEAVSMIQATPATWKMMLDAHWRPTTALKVLCGGEALSPTLANSLLANETVELWNMYGPTETTIWSCVEPILPGNLRISLGQSTANTSLYVVNQEMTLAPVGVPGELHIGGAGLARGYLNRDDLTSQKFITNPFFDNDNPNSSERLYKTGDLVRWLADGSLEFLGRIDHQVKIRGFRIELGEIEKALALHPSVKDVVVQARATTSGDKRLVGYVVTHTAGISGEGEEQLVTARHSLIEQLRQHLGQRLPDYMVPSAFVLLDKLPLTPNGKVDRKALPEADISHQQARYVAPRTKMETALCAIWQEVLGVERIGTRENFFDLGGHSLLTVKIQTKIREELGYKISITDIFTYPTVSQLVGYLTGENEHSIQLDNMGVNLDEADSSISSTNSAIAIIGMSGRFPDAKNVDIFWENIRDGVESFQNFSDEELLRAGVDKSTLADPDYVKTGVLLKDLNLFDANYFGFTPSEAEIACPQLRLLLECSLEALEHGGYGASQQAQKVGVFVGANNSKYLFNNVLPNQKLQRAMGATTLMLAVDKDYIATRISYKLNLTGPSISVNTACSTSLVAISQACLNLLSGNCDIALAGAASLPLLKPEGYLYQQGGISSPDGHCYPFDKNAKGTRFGSGVGVVLLKKYDQALRDGDTIHAVIKGVGINNDGNMKIGYTAPSVQGQANAIRKAITTASIKPEGIQYIETHGTGTKLGDPIEIAALKMGLGLEKSGNLCALGTVKANIGHTDAAAGVAGLIKTVQALKHKLIPPCINYQSANPQIDFENSPFYINTELKEWKTDGEPRRAGVSSFGIGGTNAHLIVEEGPEIEPAISHRKWRLLLVSARTDNSLAAMKEQLKNHLIAKSPKDLIDTEYTLQVGRNTHNNRYFLICDNAESAVNGLAMPNQGNKIPFSSQSSPIVFMFPGQGAQYIDMVKGLYEQEPVYRTTVDECAEFLLSELSLDIRELLYPGESARESASLSLNQTSIAQPALFVIEYAIAKLLMSWGIKPSAMIGHSVGEYVAACLSGVFNLHDALRLISARGRLMQSASVGKMLSILSERTKLLPLLKECGCELAVVNSSTHCVAAGSVEAISLLKTQLDTLNISSTELNTSHAFHSYMMDGVLDDYREVLRSIRFNDLKIPFVSNVSGKFITNEQVKTPEYWLGHLRNTVEFDQGVATLLQDSSKIFVEVGPGVTLSSLVKKHINFENSVAISTARHQRENIEDGYVILKSLGQLWQQGVVVDWSAFHSKCVVHRVPLPTYQFDRQNYWVDAVSQDIKINWNISDKNRSVADWMRVAKWNKSLVKDDAGLDLLNKHNHLIFMDTVGVGNELLNMLMHSDQHVVCVHMGEYYEQKDVNNYLIRPNHSEDYDLLFSSLRSEGRLPNKIVHLWGINYPRNSDMLDHRGFLAAQENSISSVLLLAKTVSSNRLSNIDFGVVTNNVYNVTGSEEIFAENSTVGVLPSVISQESPEIKCFHIDIDIADVFHSRHLIRLARHILSEIQLQQRSPHAAFRGRSRWEPSIDPIAIDRSDEAPSRLIANGTYIITGGLGQMGLLLAEHFAENLRAKIILVGRSAFLNKEVWQEWLREHGDDDSTSKKILRLQSMENKGAEIIIACADVSDEQQMENVFVLAESRFGKVNGVIHGAGEVNNAIKPYQEITEEDFYDQNQSKVKGVLVLDKILHTRNVDFCVLMSSVTAIFPGVGFSTYASANMFMDVFAQQKHTQGDDVWLSINWGRWNFGDEKRYSGGLSNEDGVNAFVYAMSLARAPQLIITKLMPGEKNDLLGDVIDVGADAVPDLVTRDLSSTYLEASNKLEQDLVDVWKSVLGVDKIGINDNFYELGGHSLFAIQLISRMKEVGIKILAQELIEFPTIAEISELIKQRNSTDVVDYQYKYVKGDKIHSLPNRQLLFKAVFKNHWNQAGMLNIFDPNENHLKEVLNIILNEHQGLRHVFYVENGVVNEKILDVNDSDILQIIDLSNINDEMERSSKIEALANHFQSSLDLTKNLYKFALFNCGKNEPARFLWVVHHSLMDGYSMKLFLQEFYLRYLHFAGNREFKETPRSSSVVEWANYLHNYVNSKDRQHDVDYWSSLPWNKIGVLMDYPEGVALNQSDNVEDYGKDIIVIKELNSTYSSLLLNGSTISESFSSSNIILAAFANAIATLTKSPYVRFDMLVNGRDKITRGADVDKTIGSLVDNIPVVVEVDKNLSASEYVESYHKQFSAIPSSGLGYNGLKYLSDDRDVRIKLEATGNAEFNINIVPPALLSMDQMDLTGLPVHLISMSNESSGQSEDNKLADIIWPAYINIRVNNDKYQFMWIARDNIYRKSTIEGALDLWTLEVIKMIEQVYDK